MRMYNQSLIRKPYITQSFTAAVLFGAGDILAQQGVEKRGLTNHDLLRTARLALYGGILFAPVVTSWYKMLETIQMKSRPASKCSRSLQYLNTNLKLHAFQ